MLNTAQKLNELKGSGKEIVLLTQTFASPSTSKLIAEFKENMEMFVTLFMMQFQNLQL